MFCGFYSSKPLLISVAVCTFAFLSLLSVKKSFFVAMIVVSSPTDWFFCLFFCSPIHVAHTVAIVFLTN